MVEEPVDKRDVLPNFSSEAQSIPIRSSKYV